MHQALPNPPARSVLSILTDPAEADLIMLDILESHHVLER
jgi:hypothetical protein